MAKVRFDEGDPHGRRTGDPPEAIDQQPAHATIRIAIPVVALYHPLSIGEAQ